MIEKRDGHGIFQRNYRSRQPGYGAAQAAIHNQGGTAQAELFSRYPRALEIERELSRTAAKAAKAVLTGSNARLELERLKESNQALQSELAALLKSAGVSEDYLEIRYACPLCKDEGYVDGKNVLLHETTAAGRGIPAAERPFPPLLVLL